MSAMTWEMAFVFAVIAAALALFVLERFPVEQVAVAVPAVLWVSGVLTPEEATSGFAHPATLTVSAMLVLGLGLARTGGVSWIVRWIAGAAPRSSRRHLLLLCLVVASVSPFLNNTAVVVIFLPVFLSVARQAGEAPSRYLMPLSFAAILGGTVTLVGTSTNLIVHGMARENGLDGLSMFSITPLGLIYLAVGLAYLMTVGRLLLPDRRADGPDLEERYGVRQFTTELEVTAKSEGIGKRLEELGWSQRHGVLILGIRRRRQTSWSPGAGERLLAGDVLHVRGDSEDLLTLAEEEALATPADRHETTDRRAGAPPLVEVLVAPRSTVIGRTLRGMRFAQRYAATVIGIQRHGRPIPGRLGSTRLRAGDLLLVQGRPEALEALPDDAGLVPVAQVKRNEVRRTKGLLALGILAAVVVVSAVGWAPIHAAALTGALVMVFTRCLSIQEIYRQMDWMVVFLLAGLLPLGLAMEKVGAAEWLVGHLVASSPALGPHLLVLAVYLVASLLTEVMSNNAAAVVLTPIVIQLADQFAVNPYALLVALMFGASASFMTPMGYQTNTLVYGPGGYRFADYLRVGGPLNLLLAAVATLVIPALWPS